jgi:Family of unknown function (DUF6962)
LPPGGSAPTFSFQRALATAGVALTLVAALLQQREVSIHPRYFNHSALYHVLQAVALFLIFLSGRWLVGAELSRPASEEMAIDPPASPMKSDGRLKTVAGDRYADTP